MKRTLTFIFDCITIALLFAIFIYVSFDAKESAGVQWNGAIESASEMQEVGYFKVYGFESMTFKSDQTAQEVNIYNPENDDYAVEFVIIIDGNEIWDSGTVEPGYGFYEIEIENPLEAGNYDATMTEICIGENGEKLNSCSFNFDLIVED